MNRLSRAIPAFWVIVVLNESISSEFFSSDKNPASYIWCRVSGLSPLHLHFRFVDDTSSICKFISMQAQPARWWWGQLSLHVDNDARAGWDSIINVKLELNCMMINVQLASSWMYRFRLRYERADWGGIIVNVEVQIAFSSTLRLDLVASFNMREHVFCIHHLFFMSEERVSEYILEKIVQCRRYCS